jgi:two-component system, NarL family, sensor histidine kinase DesK
VASVSSVGRQQPEAGIRARLLNRGAYQWYLGTIIGLAYQSAEIVYVWASHGAVGFKLISTVLLALFYLTYIVLPPLIWPQSTRTRIVALAIYWTASFALVPFIGTFVVWIWPLVISMIAFTWLPFVSSVIMIAIIGGVQLVFAANAQFEDGTGFAPLVTVIVAVSLFSITRQIVANQRLRDAQDRIASLAAAEERARLARDLHDVLGHSLTVVAVKSELAGRLVERDPAKAVTEIRDIEVLARTALADLRAAVSSYREMNLDAELAAARTALDAAGIRAHLPLDTSAVEEENRPLFGWVLREGVTNVIRHSRAEQCWVELGPQSLTVRDDGLGVPQGGRGNGLTGLTERALEAGAKLTTSNGETGGFVLTVALARS